MKRKILLSCYAICMLLMSVILMWRASSGYVFAHEYNSMNGKENADGEIYVNLSIGADNPFIVSTDSDIIAAIDGGYTGYIYFGYPKELWGRSRFFNDETQKTESDML